jgi:hypothetical protein
MQGKTDDIFLEIRIARSSWELGFRVSVINKGGFAIRKVTGSGIAKPDGIST